MLILLHWLVAVLSLSFTEAVLPCNSGEFCISVDSFYCPPSVKHSKIYSVDMVDRLKDFKGNQDNSWIMCAAFIRLMYCNNLR